MPKFSVDARPKSVKSKHCTKCGKRKSLSNFPPNRKMKLGVQSACRKCCQAAIRRWYSTPEGKAARSQQNLIWRQSNRERVSAYMKERYRKKRDKLLSYLHRWQHKNREYIREKQRAYYRRNKADHRRRDREWMAKNPLKVKALAAAKRARRRGVSIVSLSHEQWREIKQMTGHRCAYCGKRKRLTQDHFIPLRDGGPHRPGNVVPACHRCNCSKGAKRWEVLPQFRSLIHG